MHYPRLVILAAVVIVVAALSLAKAVLLPLALSIFLAFVLSPVVARAERLRLGRVPSVLAVALLAFVVLGGLGYVVGRQAMGLLTRLPEYRESLQAKVEIVRERVHGPLQRASEVVHEIERSATGTDAPAPAPPVVEATPLVSWATAGIGTLASVVGSAGMVALLVIIMLIQRSDLRDRFIALAGGGGVVVTTQALDEAAQRVSRYLLVVTIINASYGAAVGVALWLIGVPNAVLWGILAASLRFVPYVGPWIAAAMPILYAFAISDSFAMPLQACGLFIVFELLTNLVVEPVVLPNHIGVSETALLVSAVFWTWLWGAPGLMLAAPLTVCVAVMGKHIPQMRFLAVLLGDEPVLSPALRVYQRLLVGDAEDAWNLIAADLEDGKKDSKKDGKTAGEIYDTLLLPALCLAEQDRRDRVIDPAMLSVVATRARELAEEVSDRRGPKDAPAAVVPDPLKVVCIAAEKDSDAAASSMLRDLLKHAGVDAHEAPRGALVSEALDVVAEVKPGAICISQIPPLSFTRLRYVCKRIAERFPDTPILVGTWTMTLEPARVQERLESDRTLQVAGSLAEMLEHVARIAAQARGSARPDPRADQRPDAMPSLARTSARSA